MVTDFQVARKIVTLANNASERKASFNMSFKKVKQLLNTKRCYYTGVEMNDEQNHPNQRTFDKLDPLGAYTDDNVVVCTFTINHKKANLTFEEIEMLYTKIKRKMK